MTAASTSTPANRARPHARADLLAALARGEMDDKRVAQIAALIDVASALEDVVTAKGAAGLGSIVTVADRAGETWEYELIARPTAESARQKVALTSPTGRTLLGVGPGDHIHVSRPHGHRRRVRVIGVRPGPATSLRSILEGDAAAQ